MKLVGVLLFTALALCQGQLFVAPDPHMKRNETLRLVLTQEFFDDIQYNLIVPAIYNLGSIFNFSLGAIPWLANLSIMTVAGNVTDFQANGLGISNDTSIIQLYDDGVQFNLTNLTADLALGYEFCSDPAIIADIGFLNLTVDSLDLLFNLSSTYDSDYNLSIDVTSVHAEIADFDLGFDGLNDFMYVISGLVNRIAGIVFARIKSVIEQRIEQLVPLIN